MKIVHMDGLHPELMAAVAARTSRTEEGIESILDKVAQMPDKKAIDSVYSFGDYGHASIRDLTGTIALSIEGISLWLAFYIFYNCPIQSGQEASSRYIKKDKDKVLSTSLILHHAEGGAVMENAPPYYNEYVEACFVRYEKACTIWEWVFDNHCPEEYKSLIENETNEKVKLRYKKNFIFDRARYFLPNGCLTNIVIMQSAREWARLLKLLDSNIYPEFSALALELRQTLLTICPRSMKHSYADMDFNNGIVADFVHLTKSLGGETNIGLPAWQSGVTIHGIAHENSESSLKLYEVPPYEEVNRGFLNRNGRYGYQSDTIRKIPVKYTVNNCAFAEIRDLNRQRPGSRIFEAIPRGFYGAFDELERIVPRNIHDNPLNVFQELHTLCIQAYLDVVKSRIMLSKRNPMYIYYTTLGTTFNWSHALNLAEMAYIIELRTQKGAHYRYSKHIRQVFQDLVGYYPSIGDHISIGTAEPE